MSIWRRLLGLQDPPRLNPPLGELHRFDDDNTLHVYEINQADFNIYQDGGQYWLTLYAEARVKIKPSDEMNPHPFVELNLPFQQQPEAIVSAGKVLRIESYHEDLFNLTSMYYWTHSGFDGSLHVEEFSAAVLAAMVEGESDHDPVALRAKFQRNHERQRSFD